MVSQALRILVTLLSVTAFSNAHAIRIVDTNTTLASRSFNTTFTPEAVCNGWVAYGVTFTSPVSAISSNLATVQLLCDAAGTPTIVCGIASSGITLTVGVALGFNVPNSAQLSCFVAKGWNCRLAYTNSGSASATLASVREQSHCNEYDAINDSTGYPLK